MNALLVATRNRGKQPELRALLAPLGIAVHFPEDLGLAEVPAEGELERFQTFAENAHAKARHFHERSGLPTLADDSGIEVDALGGAPGVHSKRFAGINGADHEVAAANNAELLRRLDGVPTPRRTARFRGVLVLVRPARPDIVVDGVTEGHIGFAPQGAAGFGYDPLFVAAELGKTFGEATAAEKASVSHRARAARALIEAVEVGD